MKYDKFDDDRFYENKDDYPLFDNIDWTMVIVTGMMVITGIALVVIAL